MLISIKQRELAFTFDKNTRVKSIIPLGENEFTITFERYDEQPNLSTHEVIHVQPDKLSVQPPMQKNDILECNTPSETNFPTVEAVIEYIRSKENYTHDNAEIQEHFLGHVLNSRGEANLYHKFADVIRSARSRIEIEEQGKWKDEGIRNISKGRRVKNITFIKN